MASNTRRQESSSSDDAFTSPSSNITEMHWNENCGYKKFKLQAQGRDVYVHLRSCFCGHYRTFNIVEGVKNLDPEEGKEVHFLEQCKWRKVRKNNGWELRRQCLETSLLIASRTGNYSQPYPQYQTRFH